MKPNKLNKQKSLINRYKNRQWLLSFILPTIFILGFCLLTSCAIEPEPLTLEDRYERVAYDTNVIRQAAEPVTCPITIYEAIARAIRYNLDHRVKQLEAVLAGGQLELAKYDMLPQLLAEAAYNARNNFSGGTSISLLTGEESLVPSTSEERLHWVDDLRITWNILDLGIGYIKSKQQSDVYLISEQRRRRVVHNIVQDVRLAFWRAVTAEQRMQEIEQLLPQIQAALGKARVIEQERLQKPIEILEYQRDLLERLQTLLAVKTELSVAKTELAALINISPGQGFTLVPPPNWDIDQMAKIDVDPCVLDELALISRPELIEEDYLERVASYDVAKAWVETFPNISLDVSRNFDSNDLIFYPYWTKGIFTATGQIMAMITARQRVGQAELQGVISRARRMALSMAIMAQTRVAYMRYLLAYDHYALNDELDAVNQRIHQQVANAHKEKAQHGLELIRAKAVAIAAGIRNDVALNELQSAKSSVFLSIGLDPLPSNYQEMTVAEMASIIEENMHKWDMMQPDEFYKLVGVKHILQENLAEKTPTEAQEIQEIIVPTNSSSVEDNSPPEEGL